MYEKIDNEIDFNDDLFYSLFSTKKGEGAHETLSNNFTIFFDSF